MTACTLSPRDPQLPMAVRPLRSFASLRPLIDPASVAVIGASATPEAFGGRTMANMARYTGRLYPINPRHRELYGHPCHPDLASLPEVPECVVVAVPQEVVPAVLEDCANRGVRAAIVYASGFAETGEPAAIAAEAGIAAIAARHDLRIAGPNCVGIINVATGAGMHFMPEFDEMPLVQGRVGVISQSGALGYALIQGMNRGVGFSHYLAAGNSCDVDVCDYIGYLAQHEGTSAVACILEGIRDGERFIEAARRVYAAGKTLIVYKTGRGETSRSVAMSHTGSLIGSLAAYDAALSRAGALCVDSLDELLAAASFFAKTRHAPQGRGVGVMATSGGAAVVCADKAEEHEVTLPELAAATIERLGTVVPAFGRIANPTDTTGQVLRSAQTFGVCIEAFLQDPGIDALVVPIVFASRTASEARIRTLGDFARRYDKPIAILWLNAWTDGPGAASAEADERLTVFHSADHCFRTLQRWFALAERRRHPHPDTVDAHPRPPETVRRQIAAAETSSLSERASKAILADYGVPVTREAFAETAQAAVRAAADIGYPVALKVESPDILHKTEAGAVRLGIGNDEELRAACGAVMASARSHAPHARLTGVVVQQMVPPGVELLVGCKHDAQFGPLITVGLGGTLVELLRDTVTRLAPVSREEARQMLASLRTARLLTGFRGQAAVDLQALAQCVADVSRLAHDLRDVIDQIDVNPVIAGPQGVTAVDALIILRPRE